MWMPRQPRSSGPAAVQRLDQVLPAVKVEPIAPEAGEGGQGQ